MLPLLALGGASSAINTISSGLSWLKKQIGSDQDSSGSATATVPGAATGFQQQLALAAAGQNQPTGISSLAQNALTSALGGGTNTATTLLASGQVSTTDMLARVQAGIAAYDRVKSHS
jgi:hypothetical protein